MSHDRRFTPLWGEIAHESLRGRIEGVRFTAGARYRIAAPLADLRATPGGARERQLLTGAPFRALLWQGRAVYGFHEADGYCGWVEAAALGRDGPEASHFLAVPASHLYPAPSVKAPARGPLYLGALLAVSGTESGFARCEAGWVPARHLRRLGEGPDDPVAVARGFLGTPYMWGGNSHAGIDCSGLVQMARQACGLPCPADSDLQRAMPGQTVAPDAAQPGDLAFWPGHVGLISEGGQIIHANAHHMAVVEEPFAQAAARILVGGGGEPALLRPAGAGRQ
ncbi:MAG: C40 family peptidase [Pararhodobacter sp.]|nr:C40 family peptidase [Pararhodobacter sp.]